MTDHVWFDPSFGASGNMVLGALLALGADLTAVNAGLDRLGIDGLAIQAEPALRGSLSATHVKVDFESTAGHRPWADIDSLIAKADLPVSVASGARRTFRRLGEAEAGIHAVEVDEVHFHEVGALDAIADITGSWLAWHHLGEPPASVGPFGLGHGTIEAAHGMLPLPAPAVAELLRGWATRNLNVPMETVTPTGAALLTTLCAQARSGPPDGFLTGTGRGAGGRDPEGHPNILTAITVSSENARETSGPVETLVELSTNLDDVTGEILAHTIERCLAEGAADAWVTPILMKKGRPAHMLSALCTTGNAARLRELIMAETGTLGIRHQTVQRFAAERTFQTVEVEGHPVRIKVGPQGAKPEYDDVARIAAALGQPARQISNQALLRFAE